MKKETVIEIDGRYYDKTVVQSLLERIDALRTSGEEMGKEIATLNRQIGGYKTSNANYKKQIADRDRANSKQKNFYEKQLSDLQNEIDKTKNYAKEADEMNEEKAEQIASLNATVEEKYSVIAGLQSQIAELNKHIANNEKNIQDLTGERDVAIANYDYVCGLPWYQRMFFKGK